MFYLDYEQIDTFSLDDAKKAKLELALELSELKDDIKTLENNENFFDEIKLQKLKRKRKHFLRLTNRIEQRLIDLKSEEKQKGKNINQENQLRKTVNEKIKEKFNFTPTIKHAIFVKVAQDLLDQETLKKIMDETMVRFQFYQQNL